MNGVEAFYGPKELGDRLLAMGISGLNTARKCRSLATAMREHGMPTVLRYCVRPSDAYSFLQANPEWRPFSKTK